MNKIFADTSYFVAVVVPDDASHGRAMKWATNLPHLVTTAWVMTELAAFLSSPDNRSLFADTLTSLRMSPRVTFVPADQELFDVGVELYAARPDKAWSLVDCMSFVVMERMGITDALTGDHHFVQAGFRALLTEEAGTSA